MWLMNGMNSTGGLSFSVQDPLTVKEIGDFNGDGKSDIVCSARTEARPCG
jgi:hypothetical protein